MSGEWRQDWFWEGNIQDCVVAYLESEGWQIVSTANTATRQSGIDILAAQDARTLAVEVKGFPAHARTFGAKKGETRGLGQRNMQAEIWFGQAFMKVIKLVPHHEVALALPNMGRYRALLDEYSKAMMLLGIGAFVVTETGDVQQVMLHRTRDSGPSAT